MRPSAPKRPWPLGTRRYWHRRNMEPDNAVRRGRSTPMTCALVIGEQLPAVVEVAATAATTATTAAAATTATAAAATAAAAAAATTAAPSGAEATAAATAAATTRPATTPRAIMGDPNVDGTAIQIRLVQPVDGGLSRAIVAELDEAKPPRAPGLAIDDHRCAENLTELGKRLLQLMVHCGIGQIAHEQLRAH